jgi:hypothetical protein
VRGHFYDVWTARGFALDAPESPLVWLRFADRASFDHYARTVDRIDLSWAEGYYSARTHRVAVFARGSRPSPRDIRTPVELETSGIHPAKDAGGGRDAHDPTGDLRRLSHEAAHQLAFAGGLLERGVMYPVWVSEGLAMHFEADERGRLATTSAESGRRARLMRAARSGHLLPLSRFLALTKIPSGDRRATERVYDQAWGVFAMLLEERPRALDAYLTALERARPGRRSEAEMRAEIEAAFGDLRALDAAWMRFVLDAPATGEPTVAAAARTCG